MASMAQPRNVCFPSHRTAAFESAQAGAQAMGGLRWRLDRQLDLFWSIGQSAIDSLVGPSVRARFSFGQGILGFRVMRLRQMAIETGSGLATWQMPMTSDHLIWQWRLAMAGTWPSGLIVEHCATDFLQRTLPWSAYGLPSTASSDRPAPADAWSDPMKLELPFGRLELQSSPTIEPLDHARETHWTLDRGTLRRFDSLQDQAGDVHAMAVQGQLVFSQAVDNPSVWSQWLSRPASGQLKQAEAQGWSLHLPWPICVSGASCGVDWPQNPPSASHRRR